MQSSDFFSKNSGEGASHQNDGQFDRQLPLQEYCLEAKHDNMFAPQLLGAGGKPSTWFPPEGCRAKRVRREEIFVAAPLLLSAFRVCFSSGLF